MEHLSQGLASVGVLDTCAEQLRVSHVGDLGAANNMQGKEQPMWHKTLQNWQNV